MRSLIILIICFFLFFFLFLQNNENGYEDLKKENKELKEKLIEKNQRLQDQEKEISELRLKILELEENIERKDKKIAELENTVKYYSGRDPKALIRNEDVSYLVSRICLGANHTECEKRIFYYVRDEIRYQHDVLGLEVWQTPSETLKIKKGDCEDKAILLGSMLRTINSPEEVFINVGKKGNYGHVWVTLEGKILEPYDKNPFELDEKENYEIFYRFNDVYFNFSYSSVTSS
ncbi:MAG: transglutaminase domain-containing protein [Candidatus Hydrothermarchaeota archaeon]